MEHFRLSKEDADRLRLREIEEEIRKPRNESRYWRDPAVQDEYLNLLDRQNARANPRLAPREDDADRKVEIEAEISKGRSGAYWRPGSFMPEEYRGILEREIGETDRPKPTGSAEPKRAISNIQALSNETFDDALARGSTNQPTGADGTDKSNDIQLAAAGDLRCDGFPAGCHSGGTFGTTGMYAINGSILCHACAVKVLGIGGLPSGAQTRRLRRYLIGK